MKVLNKVEIGHNNYAKNDVKVICEVKPCDQRDLSCSGKTAYMPPR